MAGDYTFCSQFVQKHLDDNFTLQKVYEEILKRSLYTIGELWEANKISVATEHLASSLVETIINEFYPLVITQEKTHKSVVLACIEKETHQIGIRMVNDIFELHGWQTHFLGANTPKNDILLYTQKVKPHLVALSLSLYSHLNQLEEIFVLGRFFKGK